MPKYDLAPLGDRLLIRPVELEREGLIVAPPSAAEKPTVGEVIGVGASVQNAALFSAKLVLYGKFTGTPVELTGESLLIVRAEDVLAIVYDREADYERADQKYEAEMAEGLAP